MPRKTDVGNADAMPSVKLYVASTGWPYKPRWSPQSPLILLTGGAEEEPAYMAGGSHACKRFKNLLCAVTKPGHDDIFVVDISQIASTSEWRDELDKPGRATKTLTKWFIKFNPCAAVIVTHGVDVKIVEAMVRGWTTPCTSPVEAPVEKIVVVGQGIDRKMLESVGECAKVSVVNPSVQAIKKSISGGRMDNCSPVGVRMSDLHFVSVEFSLDPFEKSVVQKPIDITPLVLCNGAAPTKLPTREGMENDLHASEKVATHHLDFGMLIDNLVVQITSIRDADAMLNVVVADAHGSIEALASKTLNEGLHLGAILSVSGRVMAVQGCRVLLIEHARTEDRLPHDYASVRVGQRNVSQQTHSCGCLVIRGSKCLLLHKNDAVHIPFTAPKIAESKVQAATRAVKESCKIYVQEFALLADVPPAVSYDRSGERIVVCTAFLAVATGPPPAADGCGCVGPTEHDDSLYEWYSFEEAISVLKSEAERKCLLNLTWAFAEVVDAGVVTVDSPFAFRPKLAAIDNEWEIDKGLNKFAALACKDSEGPSFQLSSNCCTSASIKKKAGKPKRACCGPGGCSKKGCC